MLLLVYIGVCLIRNSITVESQLTMGVKWIYIGIVTVSVAMYMILKKRLIKKLISVKLITIYRYMYLAVVTLVSRIGLVYLLSNRDVQMTKASFSNGLGSYLFKGINAVVDNPAFTNILINTVITYLVVLLIKNILVNITKSDFLSTLAAIVYIFLPQSIYFVTEYNRYNFNLLFVLSGFYLLINIIDVVKQYKLKTNKYIHMSIILALIASIDIILGGSYVFWIFLVVILSSAATYIDIAHISFGQTIKSKANFKLSKLLYKIEQTNFSKLINTALIVIVICGVTSLIVLIASNSSNYVTFNSMSDLINKVVEVLTTSRNYYIVLIIAIVLLEIVGVILKRNLDIKMICVKILNILVIALMMFSKDLIYTATIFDVTLILLLVSNMCNIYYNREEKIKLLKEKN